MVIKAKDTEFLNPKNHPSCGNFPMGQWFKLKALQLMTPVDRFEKIPLRDVRALLKETKFDQCLPEPNTVFENPSSDEGLIRQAFYGLACHRVEEVNLDSEEKDTPKNAVFKVDMLFMRDLEVRPGFERHGACAHFDQDQKPVAIQNMDRDLVFLNKNTEWEVAKFSWRSSLIALVTAVDHLHNLHFAVAAQGLRAMDDALPSDSPIKRVLQIFTMRTALINAKAGTALLPENSILHHITGLAVQG